jgi:hypothetical protein
MTDRAGTLVDARRERLERLLGRPLAPPVDETDGPLSEEARRYLEWEHITDEEALDHGPLTQLAFPGFLAFIRGLLLHEVMPDSKAPASPRPPVVEDVLAFLARRVVELEDGLTESTAEDGDKLRNDLEMTSHLIDLVLYQFHGVSRKEMERIEADRRAPA